MFVEWNQSFKSLTLTFWIIWLKDINRKGQGTTSFLFALLNTVNPFLYYNENIQEGNRMMLKIGQLNIYKNWLWGMRTVKLDCRKAPAGIAILVFCLLAALMLVHLHSKENRLTTYFMGDAPSFQETIQNLILTNGSSKYDHKLFSGPLSQRNKNAPSQRKMA